jgi:predicted  nucleic acid-binding Zn-ribbon protein
MAIPRNVESQRAFQMYSGNTDPDSEPEADGDEVNTNSEIRILRKEVNELREKYGQLKGKIDSLPEVMQRDLKSLGDNLTRDLNHALSQRFGQIDQKIAGMDSDIKALREEVAPLVHNIQNLQISISQHFGTPST